MQSDIYTWSQVEKLINQAVKKERNRIIEKVEEELSEKKTGVTGNLVKEQFFAVRCSDIDKILQKLKGEIK